MADNWQEALVEELAKKECNFCEHGVPLTMEERWHEFSGHMQPCHANRKGLREAIRRTLEKAAEDLQKKFGGHLFSCEINNGLEKPCTCGYAAALRQLMPPK